MISYRNQPFSLTRSIVFATILTQPSLRFVRGAFLSFPSRLLSLRGSGVVTTQSYSTPSQCSMSFLDFLSSSTPIQPHVVLGNEAGDADSIVSSLAFGFVDSVYKNNPTTPIVSIPRADLCLRRETILLLQYAGVTQVDKLHYIDDQNVFAGVESITLVDHNRMTLETGSDSIQVVEILDHHYDEGEHSNVQGDLRIVAFEGDKATVASTCTLVAERLFQSSAKPPYDTGLSMALLGVILLDTVNMKPEAGKGTARDQAAIDKLTRYTDWTTLDSSVDKKVILTNIDGTTIIDTDKLFRLLSDSKYDVDFWKKLCVTDALRLDYKRFQASNDAGVFGASTVLLDLDLFLSKDNLVEQVQSYMKQADIPLLVVMISQFRDNTPRRELLLCGTDDGLVNEMAKFLLTSPDASLMQAKAVPLGIDDYASGPLVMQRLRQGNPKASRKQVAPIMLSFYAKTNTKTSSSL